MKKSHVVLLSAFVFAVVLMIFLIVFWRVAVGSAHREGALKSMSRVENGSSPNLEGFESVWVDGAWAVTIEQSDEFFVDLRHPSKDADTIRVDVFDDALIMKIDDGHSRLNDEYAARIGMPSLRRLRITGIADAGIEGFDEESLEVVIDGMANVGAVDSQAGRLDVRLNGCGHRRRRFGPADHGRRRP